MRASVRLYGVFGFGARTCMHMCVAACVWRTTRETDDRAPLTPEPHTGLVWKLANGYGVPRDD